jgi:hypothetical protein
MPSPQLQETNDPRALSAFGMGDVQEVTDPETLKRFLDTPSPDEAEPINYGKDVGTYGAFVSGFASDENELKRYLASKLFLANLSTRRLSDLVCATEARFIVLTMGSYTRPFPPV